MKTTESSNRLASGSTDLSAKSLAERACHPVVQAVILLVLVIVAYWPAVHAGFIMDDDVLITQNHQLTDAGGLREIWFSTNGPSQYFPLTYTTFWLEHALWGFNPLGYHLVNILWHGVNALLIWVLLRRLRIPGAWLAAALFGLHPVEVETVAWSAELKNIESLFFYLLALLAWLKFIDLPGANRWGFYGVTFLAFLLALFAKTTACTLPAALVLLLWLRRQRLDAVRALQILPFVAAGLILGLVSVWWEKHLGDYVESFGIAFTPIERVLIASRALWFYAGKLLWPLNLTFSYPQWEINPGNLLQYLPLLACLLAGLALWIRRQRLGRDMVAGILYFAAALSPLLGFVIEGTFHYTYVADHYQYGASFGLLAIFAAIAWRWLAPFRVGKVLSVALLLVLATLTWRQCRIYHNQISLWKDTLAKNPNSWMAHHNLGIAYFKHGDVDLALNEYRTAVQMYPQGCPEQSDLGTALLAKGFYDEAIEHLEAALAVNPRHFPAQNNLALAYSKTGNDRLAEQHFREAIKMDPQAFGTSLNYGRMLEREGKLDEAIECYRNAVNHNANEPAPLFRLSSALMAKGLPDQAVNACKQAVQNNPHSPDFLMALGGVYFATTNYEMAAESYQQALQITPKDPELHYNLGVVFGRQGKADAERQELAKALQLRLASRQP